MLYYLWYKNCILRMGIMAKTQQLNPNVENLKLNSEYMKVIAFERAK